MNNSDVICRLIAKKLYENLRNLKIRGLIGVIGSLSFSENNIILHVNNANTSSDLDLVVLLTLKGYIKYLILKTFKRKSILPTKISLRNLNIAISYWNVSLLNKLGNLNYIDLFEFKVISPKTYLPQKYLFTSIVAKIPMVDIYNLFISCLADILCLYCTSPVNNAYRVRVIKKRLKFLGYIYCLIYHFDFINKLRNRTLCLELLKSQLLQQHKIVEISDTVNDYDCIDLINSFVSIFAVNILRLKDGEKIINALLYDYFRKIYFAKRKLINMITKIAKFLMDNSLANLIDLKFYLRYRIDLYDFLRLAVLIIIKKKIYEKKHLSENILLSLCQYWKKYMI